MFISHLIIPVFNGEYNTSKGHSPNYYKTQKASRINKIFYCHIQDTSQELVLINENLLQNNCAIDSGTTVFKTPI